MKTNKKRQREHSFSEEIIHSSNLNLDLTEKISNAKQAKNLQKLFKDKCLIDILPTHEAELTPVTDFKLTYQIRQVIKTKSIINCNTLISLFGKQKKFDAALTLYSELIKANICPNIYTLTCIVNACVRCSELQRAQTYMKDMKSIGIKPNEVTYTVLIKGFCQEGLIEEALNNLKIMKSESIYPNIRTYNTILRGCLRCGKLLEARSIIKDMKQNNIKLDVTSYEYFIKGLCPYLKIKEAWKLAIGLKNKGIFQSSIFSAIAIAASLKNLFKFATKAIEFASEGLKLNIINTQGLKKRNSVSLFMEIRNEEIEKECLRVSEYISKPENKTNRINSVMSSNKVKFFSSKKTSNIEIIQFENIFNNNLPIKLEICSGHGDWIIERAYEDQGKYNWVALEIRFERVYTIFSKMVFKKLDNLMILGGEASDILSHCIQNNTFLEIFINYPDPPVWEQSQWLLINYKFLENVHRVLNKHQCITIVTDDKGYSKVMIQEFKKVSNLFQSSFGKQELLNQVPEGYGSSYFDRFWIHGNRKTRFFLKYKAIYQ